MLSVDEVVDAFALLALELPDAKQELSPQNLGRKLETFTCFSRLPPELRRIIWEFTFPGKRLIDLTLRRGGSTKNIFQQPADPQLPIGLHVSRESRLFTLKTYHIISQQQPIHTYKNKFKPGIRPICFDPLVDVFCIDSLDLFNHFNPDKVIPGSGYFELIKRVEVRGFNWWGHGYEEWDHFSTAELIEHAEGGVLKVLPGLEEFHLVGHEGEEDMFDEPPEDSNDCFLKLKSYFDQQKLLDPKRQLPRMYAHNYRRRTTRTDEDDIKEELVEWPLRDEEIDDE